MKWKKILIIAAASLSIIIVSIFLFYKQTGLSNSDNSAKISQLDQKNSVLKKEQQAKTKEIILKNTEGDTTFQTGHAFLINKNQLVIQTENTFWYIDIAKQKTREFAVSTKTFKHIQIADKYLVWTEKEQADIVHFVNIDQPKQKAQTISITKETIQKLNVDKNIVHLQTNSRLLAYDLNTKKPVNTKKTELLEQPIFQSVNSKVKKQSNHILAKNQRQQKQIKVSAEHQTIQVTTTAKNEVRTVDFTDHQLKKHQFIPFYNGDYLLQVFYERTDKNGQFIDKPIYYMTDTKTKRNELLNKKTFANLLPITYTNTQFITNDLNHGNLLHQFIVQKDGRLQQKMITISAEANIVDVLLSSDDQAIVVTEVIDDIAGENQKHIVITATK